MTGIGIMLEPYTKTSLPEISWPPLASRPAAAMISLLAYLEQSQWWPQEKLVAHQLKQARIVLEHARKTSRYYREKLSYFDYSSDITMERWREIPLLSRSDIQSAGESLFSSQVPPTHGRVFKMQSTGSTGQPVVTRGTGLTNLFWNALTIRELGWHKRSLQGTLAIIRAFDRLDKLGNLRADWGAPFNLLYQTGPSALLNILVDIREQAQWLRDLNPHYLLTYPTNLAGLLELFERTGERLPRLLQVRTISETLTPEIREMCKRVWGVPVVDLYSSSEAGNIAFQCPDGDCYHIQSESLLVEILDDSGKPCAPGQVGQVVITPLHNFASPLIRYAIGDYAEVAEPCKCGRGLPAFRQVLGRRRNLITLPTGERFWPRFGFQKFSEIAPIRQYQVIQRAIDILDMRLVSEHQLNDLQETQLKEVISKTLGYPFEIRFSYHAVIPSVAGKHEEFISEVF